MAVEVNSHHVRGVVCYVDIVDMPLILAWQRVSEEGRVVLLQMFRLAGSESRAYK